MRIRRLMLNPDGVRLAHSDGDTRRDLLEELYRRYNRREFVHPDPLEFLYHYEQPEDVEVAGLVAALLAYGRVEQILRSVREVLARMGSPAGYLRSAPRSRLTKEFRGFRHRFTSGEEVSSLLEGARSAIERYGSLGRCFAAGLEEGEETVLGAMGRFAEELSREGGYNSLVSCPGKGSACKRLCLYLRWMVRKDEVDPGVWGGVAPAKLIVPLDTHMHRFGRGLGLTRRKQADMRTALEVTEAFRLMSPGDPVKYDFALTRLGIRGNADWSVLSPVTESVEASNA